MSGKLTAEALIPKAVRASTSARALLDLGDVDGACNRAYYAMFDAARAALLASGTTVQPNLGKTHTGLIAVKQWSVPCCFSCCFLLFCKQLTFLEPASDNFRHLRFGDNCTNSSISLNISRKSVNFGLARTLRIEQQRKARCSISKGVPS